MSPAHGSGEGLEAEVRPPSPFRLPAPGGDRVLRRSGGVATRLLHVGGAPVTVHAWQLACGAVRFRAEPPEPATVAAPDLRGSPTAQDRADRGQLETAIERMRFALGVDDDLSDFYRCFRRDPLLGPLLRRRPHLRPRRRPWPWEALAWAVTNQLIEAVRAARIQRRIVRRWGPRLGEGAAALRDVPCAAVIAGRAPAELESTDLAARRAIALREVACDVAGGRCDPSDPGSDARLLARRNIGPWTVQCLGLHGRGDPDSLPAGDLAYLKLVGRLAGLGRRATIPEVESFYAPYEPYRGLAGVHTVAGLHHLVARGGPQRLAA